MWKLTSFASVLGALVLAVDRSLQVVQQDRWHRSGAASCVGVVRGRESPAPGLRDTALGSKEGAGLASLHQALRCEYAGKEQAVLLDDTECVRWHLVDSAGATVSMGIAEPVEDGTWRIVLYAEEVRQANPSSGDAYRISASSHASRPWNPSCGLSHPWSVVLGPEPSWTRSLESGSCRPPRQCEALPVARAASRP
jgi:hypothetical protein